MLKKEVKRRQYGIDAVQLAQRTEVDYLIPTETETETETETPTPTETETETPTETETETETA